MIQAQRQKAMRPSKTTQPSKENVPESRQYMATTKVAETKAVETQKKQAPAAGTKTAEELQLDKAMADVRALKAKLQNLTRECDSAVKEVAIAKKMLKKKTKVSKQVPKPLGSFGMKTYVSRSTGKTIHGYNLQESMGLGGEKGSRENIQYNDKFHSDYSQAGVRHFALRCRLDLNCSFKDQEIGRIVQVCSAVREAYPYMARFVNDWATTDILKQYLTNKVRTRNSKRRRVSLVAQESDQDISTDSDIPQPPSKCQKTHSTGSCKTQSPRAESVQGSPVADRANASAGAEYEYDDSVKEEQQDEQDEDTDNDEGEDEDNHM